MGNTAINGEINRASPVPLQGSVTLTSNAGSDLLSDGSAVIANLASTGALLSLQYHWFADGAPVSTTDEATLFLGAAYIGKHVSVNVTGVDAFGGQYSFSSNSMPVFNVNNAPYGTLAISGSQSAGSVLHVDASFVSDADGVGPMSFQWQADGQAIAGASGADWTVTPALVGKTITVAGSYVDAEGHAEVVSSVFKYPPAPPHTTSIAIVGKVAAGATLHAVLSNDAGVPTAFYQWQTSENGLLWTNIAGATASTVTLGAVAPALVRVMTQSIDGKDIPDTNHLIAGNDSANTLYADGASTFVAAGGNDIIYGTRAVGDTIDGGAGRDTFVSPWSLANGVVAHTGAHAWTVNGASLHDVERVQFTDFGLALDIDGAAGQTYRLYQAAFGRTPDATGVGFWINQLDQGATAGAIAGAFIQSAEFASLYGATPSNADLVTRFYQNILHRAPDATGYQYWVGVLNSHSASVADVLVQFSNSDENVAALAPALDHGIVYTPVAAVPALAGPVPVYLGTVPTTGAAYLAGSALGQAYAGSYLTPHTVADGFLATSTTEWFVDGKSVDVWHNGGFEFDHAMYVSDAYAGKQIWYTVTGIDSTGAPVSWTSNHLPVIHVNSVPKGHVDQAGTLTIAGTLAAGQSLHAIVNDPDGVDAVFYQWQASDAAGNWSNVAAGTGASITLGASAPTLVRVIAESTDMLGGVNASTTLLGTTGNDSITITFSHGAVQAGAGNDSFVNSGTGNTIDGGAGLDTYSMGDAGYYSTTSLVRTGTHQWTLASEIGPGATLIDVERIQLYDGNLALDTDGVAGAAYRLYQAAFDRVPDTVGLGFWINSMDKGDSAAQVAAAFVQSAEFTALYGANPGSTALVDQFYQNILHRAPDAVGEHYWVDLLDRHVATVAGVLLAFSDSPENVAALVGVMSHGIQYTPYV